MDPERTIILITSDTKRNFFLFFHVCRETNQEHEKTNPHKRKFEQEKSEIFLITFQYRDKVTHRPILGSELIHKKPNFLHQHQARYTHRIIEYSKNERTPEYAIKRALVPDANLIKKFLVTATIHNNSRPRDFYIQHYPEQKKELIAPQWKKDFLQTIKIIISTEGKLCEKGFSGEQRRICEACMAYPEIRRHRVRKVNFRTTPIYPKNTFKIKCECLYCHKRKSELGLLRPSFYYQFYKTKIYHPTDLSSASKFNICFEARKWNEEKNVKKYANLKYGRWSSDWKYYWETYTNQDKEFGEIVKWNEDFLDKQTNFSKNRFLTIRYDEEL